MWMLRLFRNVLKFTVSISFSKKANKYFFFSYKCSKCYRFFLFFKNARKSSELKNFRSFINIKLHSSGCSHTVPPGWWCFCSAGKSTCAASIHLLLFALNF
jgi:hypothetical protein